MAIQPVVLPGKPHGQRRIVGYSPWGYRSMTQPNKKTTMFPRWLSGKESACSAGATGEAGLIPSSGRSPGEGHGYSFQYSCLENPMDRGAWRAIQSMWSQRVRHD